MALCRLITAAVGLSLIFLKLKNFVEKTTKIKKQRGVAKATEVIDSSCAGTQLTGTVHYKQVIATFKMGLFQD